MNRGLFAEQKKVVRVRTSWVIVPQCGRLMALALDAAEDRLDATSYSVATGGLSQGQIDATHLRTKIDALSFGSLLRLGGRLFRRPTPEAPKGSRAESREMASQLAGPNGLKTIGRLSQK